MHGLTLRRLAALVALSGMAACTSVRAETCDAAIPLNLTGLRPSVMLSVNGGDPMPAMFDTGAMATIVSIANAEALRLRNTGPLGPPFDQPGHSASGYQTLIGEARIGGTTLRNLSAPVMPLPLAGFVAVISPNIFAGRLVVVDLGAAALTICDKATDTMPTSASYAYSEGPFVLPTLPVTVEDETIQAHLDTGSQSGLTMPMAYAEKFQLAGPMRRIGIARTHSGEMPIFSASVIGTVQVGPLTLINPDVRFTDIVPDVNVGMLLLTQMKITLDPEMHRLWASRRSS